VHSAQRRNRACIIAKADRTVRPVHFVVVVGREQIVYGKTLLMRCGDRILRQDTADALFLKSRVLDDQMPEYAVAVGDGYFDCDGRAIAAHRAEPGTDRSRLAVRDISQKTGKPRVLQHPREASFPDEPSAFHFQCMVRELPSDRSFSFLDECDQAGFVEPPQMTP